MSRARASRAARLPVLRWHFPLPRTHTGVLLGNGIQGLMVWGETSLNVTVGHAGFWDHRGGNVAIEKTTFAEVRRLLEAGDLAGVKALFANPSAEPGRSPRPQQLGGGRLEWHFARGLRPRIAELDLRSGVLSVAVGTESGEPVDSVRIEQAAADALFWVTLDENRLGPITLRLVPAWEHIGEQLALLGIAPPDCWETDSEGGFVQSLPADPPLALGWRKCPGGWAVASAVADDARALVTQRLNEAATAREREAAARLRWRRRYWRQSDTVSLPEPDLQFVWHYGLH
ncbi:MAG: hypothetical protein RMK20_00440 [Verrucomicrobiales bacterium]|nr:hypothetical protein [Verrucomicrobiales bacterium]